MENNLTFSQFINSEKVINNILKRLFNDKKMATRFIADLTSVVNNNYQLQNCDKSSIISAGFMAQALNLSLSPTLQRCYMIPYGDKAQFQIGYKGLRELAMRTGLYSKADSKEIHKSELLGRDEFGDAIIKFNSSFDYEPSDEIVGYYAYLVEKDGTKQTLYMSQKQCEEHGKKYSKSYGSGKSTDCWKNIFDDMAKKTVLKLLLGKQAVLSAEIEKAVKYDQAVIGNNGEVEYIDNPQTDNKKVIETHTNNLAEHLKAKEIKNEKN